MDEAKAHSRLQSTARRKRIKLVELARMILLVQEVFDAPEEVN
jgi:AmiR/NasT family two-component response regulator